MIKAIAWDPGITTGFATGEISEAKDGIGLHHSVPDYGALLVQTAQAKLSHKDLFEFLQNYKPDYIICERFDFRQQARTGLELISREFIGIINLYDSMNDDCTLVLQTAAQALAGYWGNNEKLKRLGLYRKPIEGVSQIHANEACKHLLYWYKFGSGSQYGKEIRPKQSSTIQEETTYGTSEAQPIDTSSW